MFLFLYQNLINIHSVIYSPNILDKLILVIKLNIDENTNNIEIYKIKYLFL